MSSLSDKRLLIAGDDERFETYITKQLDGVHDCCIAEVRGYH